MFPPASPSSPLEFFPSVLLIAACASEAVFPTFICRCQFITSEISPLEFQLRGFKVSGSVVERVIKQAGCCGVTGLRGLSRPTAEQLNPCRLSQIALKKHHIHWSTAVSSASTACCCCWGFFQITIQLCICFPLEL